MSQPLPDEAPGSSAPARPRRFGLGALIAVTVGAVLVVVSLAVWLALGRNASETPPPSASSVPGPELLLSAEVAPAGAEVLGVLVDETDSGQHFDQLGSVEEWRDGAWVAEGRSLLWCLPDDDCASSVSAPGVMYDFAPADIAPSDGEPGPVMRMTTAGLKPGWYRITHVSRSGVLASAVLQIAEDAPVPAVVSPIKG